MSERNSCSLDLLQDVVRHHRQFRRLAAGDVGDARWSASRAVSTVSTPLASLLTMPMMRAVVGGDDPRRGVFLRDDRARVEDVFEQVVEVAAIGAGDLGADLAADAVERVAVAGTSWRTRPGRGSRRPAAAVERSAASSTTR